MFRLIKLAIVVTWAWLTRGDAVYIKKNGTLYLKILRKPYDPFNDTYIPKIGLEGTRYILDNDGTLHEPGFTSPAGKWRYVSKSKHVEHQLKN